ncbi:MAG: DUF1015 domain-containing protein [Desulfobacteraceae bacterium]|nr:DUF1015 domain-containing protein [Desulfobacteraceae bacterium]
MAFIVPFRGLRYNPAKVSRLEEVVTPPYDIIDDKAQAAFAARSPYNMIRLDLSKSVGAEELGADRYEQARQRLEEWELRQVLVRDPLPAVYLYHVDYSLPSGRRLTRKGLVALARLAEFHEGVVKPHEKTFRGVITDRLRLLDACRTQFSQIFALYPDEENAVMTRLERSCPAEPLSTVVDDNGTGHRLWAVTDPDALADVHALFAGKSLYIADGHHRYTTALQLRERMREQCGPLPAGSPFDHTMMYLCGMDDPGLSVLPTHRLVRLPGGRSAADLAGGLGKHFAVEEVTGASREVLAAEALSRMEERRGTVFGLYHPGEDRCFLLTLKEGVMAAEFGGNSPLLDLDVVVLSDLILDRLLGLGHGRCEQEHLVDYYSDPDEAMDAAVKEAAGREGQTPVIFLMNPTRIGQVKQVADANLVMPHKSTFFYPKILTGLVMSKLDERVG